MIAIKEPSTQSAKTFQRTRKYLISYILRDHNFYFPICFTLITVCASEATQTGISKVSLIMIISATQHFKINRPVNVDSRKVILFFKA